ncbi:MAG: methyltransferase [candidate division WOR-3 bacterium]
MIRRLRVGRLLWTFLVGFYFMVFFYNFFNFAYARTNSTETNPQATLPILFAIIFVGWLMVEYYYGFPFFQSGIVEASAFWRGVFAFFVYPYFGFLAADFLWWRVSQIPVPIALTGVLGLALFGLGVYLRLNILFSVLNIAEWKPGDGRRKEECLIPEKRFVALRLQRICRHPRYLGTFIQLIGAALVFRSWGGLVLALVLGLPLIWVQVRHEDKKLRPVLKNEFNRYGTDVPMFWPRFR